MDEEFVAIRTEHQDLLVERQRLMDELEERTSQVRLIDQNAQFFIFLVAITETGV